MDFSIEHLINAIPLLLKGALITFQVSIIGALFGIGVGLILILMRMSRLKVINSIARIYISLIRGTPLLVQIFFIFRWHRSLLVMNDISIPGTFFIWIRVCQKKKMDAQVVFNVE